MTPLRRVIDPLLQRPLRVRRARLRGTAKPHALADVVAALEAALALLAGQPHFQGHAVADAEVRGGDFGAYAHDYAGGLVAEGERFATYDVAVAEVLVVVQVGAAETGCCHCDLEFMGRGCREGALVLG